MAAVQQNANDLKSGKALSAADLAALPAHLGNLSVAQRAQLLAFVGQPKSGTAKAQTQRLVTWAGAQTAKINTPPAPPPPPPPPTKSQQKAAAQAASATAVNTMLATLASGNPLSAADLAALPGHLGNFTAVGVNAVRTRLGVAKDKTKTASIARLTRYATRVSGSAAARQRPAPTPAATPPVAPPQPAPPVAPSRQTSQPPGPPPRPGLKWDGTSHRWVLENGGVFGGYAKPAGQKLTSSDRFSLNQLVDAHLAQQGVTATDVLKTGKIGDVITDLRKFTDGSVGHFDFLRSVKTHAAMESTGVIPPLFPDPYAANPKNGPNPNLPDGTRPGNLTADEKTALQKYTSAVYAPLNDSLRKSGAVPAALTDLHNGLQGAFAKAPVLAKPIDAVRGLKIDAAQLPAFLNQFRNGTTLALPGYQSTTPGTKPDPFFKGNVQLNIKAVKGLDLSPLTHFPGSPAQEFLLDHNSNYKVGNVKVIGGVTHIDLEQVVPGAGQLGAAPAKPGLWSRLMGRGATPTQVPAPTPPAPVAPPPAPLSDTKSGVGVKLRNLLGVQSVVADPAKATSVGSNANNWTFKTDDVSNQLSKDLGTDGPPTVVTSAQMDGLKAQGWHVGFRGVGDPKFHDNHRTGPLWTGTGLYGAGTYVAIGTGPDQTNDAKTTARSFGRNVTRFALPPTAKIIKDSALMKEQKKDQKTLSKEYAAGTITGPEYNAMRGILADKGRYAMLKGYDALQTDHTNYLIIVNRKNTTMQDTNI